MSNLAGSDEAATFVVPCFNSANTVCETLDSIRRQSWDRWTAVVVDDGSSDNTVSVVEAIAEADKRIRLVKQTNKGAAAARNFGLEHVKASRVAFLDSDDWIEPDYLEKMLGLIETDTDIPYCAFRRMSPSGVPSPPSFCPALQHSPMAILAERCDPAIHSILAPTELIKAVGGFDVELECCEDWDLWIRLVRAGGQFRAMPQVLAYYRMRSGSLSTISDAVIANARTVQQRIRSSDPRVKSGPQVYSGGWQGRPFEQFQARANMILQKDVTASNMDARLQELLADFDFLPRLEMLEVVAEMASERPGLFDLLDGPDGACILLPLVKDMAHARLAISQGTRQGRWLTSTLDPSFKSLPRDDIHPDDILVCYLPGLNQPEQLAEVPGNLVKNDHVISRTLMHLLPMAELVRSTRPWINPSFWGGVFKHLVKLITTSPRRLAENRRLAVGQIVRAGIADMIGINSYRQPKLPPLAARVPVLLFPEIVRNEELETIDYRLSVGEACDLIGYLRATGYNCGHLADLAEARRSGSAVGSSMCLVFNASPASGSPLRRVTSLAANYDVLLCPAQIKAGACERSPGARYGLYFPHELVTPDDALHEAISMAKALHRLNNDQRPLVALAERPGWNDLILREAGFEVILSRDHSAYALGSAALSTSCMPVSSADGIGAIIERLRPPG